MTKFQRRFALTALVVLASAIGVAACGGGGSSTGSTTASGGESTSAGAPTAEAKNASAGKSAAEELIKPLIGQPSPFPVTESLTQVPKGATIAYMDCGSPICALLWELMEPAATTMGVHLERIKAGSAANTVSAAFDTVVTKQPAAVIVGAINVELWASQAKELQQDNIPVVTTGVTGAEPYGVVAPQSAEKSNAWGGERMAAYVAAKMHPDANVVFSEIPELPLTVEIAERFSEKLPEYCPECTVRTVDIGIETIGNTAPQTIVSDLQAHPETNVVVLGSDEVGTGLPAALQAAGLSVETLGYFPSPTGLQYVKEGKETAVLASDLALGSWNLVDLAARDINGQKPGGEAQAEGITVQQFLTQKDITFNPAKGWSGYPDFPERFAKLWGVKP